MKTENYCDNCDAVLNGIVNKKDFYSFKIGKMICPECKKEVMPCNECEANKKSCDACSRCPYKKSKLMKLTHCNGNKIRTKITSCYIRKDEKNKFYIIGLFKNNKLIALQTYKEEFIKPNNKINQFTDYKNITEAECEITHIKKNYVSVYISSEHYSIKNFEKLNLELKPILVNVKSNISFNY